jgi:hypothetical protein
LPSVAASRFQVVSIERGGEAVLERGGGAFGMLRSVE